MATLPAGTITFLFSDIEGSSRLWEQYPRAMQRALARHDAILSQAITTQNGVVFKTVGDSYCAAFQRASDAVAAALDAQRALASEAWEAFGLPAPEGLRVRMAIHTGVAELRDDDYFGPALNRVARLMDAGHGGQVLLSRAAADLVYDLLPPGVALRDLGDYDLKNLSHPERIFQLVAPAVPTPSLPLRAAPSPATAAPAALPPLLKTKLVVPLPRVSLLARPSLFQRLSAGLRRKLTLISAPPGFGKTTLLSAWRASADGRDVPIAWVSLDDADNDPARFWAYVIAALDTVQKGVGAAAQALLRSSQPPPIESILTELINDLMGVSHDMVLVLDDYHLVTTPAIHAALTFLLDHLPPQLHVVIASRTDPVLPLARWRARGDLLELRVAELRFTNDEAEAFLHDVMGLDLLPEAVSSLEARTEGWVAGLQLAALSLQGLDSVDDFIKAFTGSHRHIADYLTEEVLQRQPAHLRAFLLQTSILDRMCGPLCDAVLGLETKDVGLAGSAPAHRPPVSSLTDSYSRLLLEELERAHLFVIPLDHERQWYRYHHLFADVLRYRLKQDQPDRVPELHQRAARWYEQQELLPEALAHLLAAGDTDEAARLVEHMRPLRALARGEGMTVQRWLGMLPDAAILTRPVLCLARARLLQRSTPAEVLEQWLQDAERGLAHDHGFVELGGERVATIRGEIAAMRAHMANTVGDMPRAIVQCRVALEQLPAEDLFARASLQLILGMALRVGGDLDAASAAFAEASALGSLSGNMRATLMSRCMRGLIHVARGQLYSAAALYREAIQLGNGPDGQPLPVAQAAHRLLGDLLREWNDLAGAERLLTEATSIAERNRLIAALPVTYCLLARVQQARGDAQAAFATIQRAQAVVRERGFVREEPILAAKAAEARFRAGDLAGAIEWASSYRPSAARFETDEWPRETDIQLIYARIRVAQGRPGEVLGLLADLIAIAESHGLHQTLLEALVVQALGYAACGDHGRALASVGQAVNVAEPGGYVRVFADEGGSMARLLQQIHDSSAVASYVEKLLTAFDNSDLPTRSFAFGVETSEARTPNPQTSPEAQCQLEEPLTERETEVLRLVAAGMSSPEIAQHFVVSINTVKTQIKSIYGKLDVHTRSEAIAKARSLHLVP